MKILIVGTGMWPWYESACAAALEMLGCQVEQFSWVDDFYRWVPGRPEPAYRSNWTRLQNRLLFGPALDRINSRLLSAVEGQSPDVIFFYNCTHIFPSTVRRLRRGRNSPLLAQYANDNPFSPSARKSQWRHLMGALPYFDIHFAFRASNIPDYRRLGAKRIELLRAYFIPGKDFRVVLSASDGRFMSDVVFAGHYEDDGRLEQLESLASMKIRLNLFGGGWSRAESKLGSRSPLRAMAPIIPAVGEDYRKAISGAKIALCFLSKLNQDVYTTRNFEIPAMGTFMLSEFSDDLASLFREGVDAEFFRSREELMDKVAYYLRHDSEREKIARNGFERVRRDGHDVVSRMRSLLSYCTRRSEEVA